MSLNLDAVLRLVFKTEGTEAITKVQTALGGVEQTLGSARKAFGNVVSSATWQTAAVAAAGIGAGLGKAVLVAKDFEQAMSSVGAKTGATGEEMSQLERLAREMGRTTKFTAIEAAEGMDFLAMAGFKTNEILAAMPGIVQLATAANADIAMTADIVSDTLGAMGLEADYTGRMVDIMAAGMTNANFDMGMLGETMKNSASVAREFGMSFEELIAATDALAFGGIKGAEAGNALKRVMLLLAAPTDAAGKLLEQLGVSAADTEGNMRPLNEIFGDLGRAMDAAGMSEQQRLQTLETLFGKQAAVGAATLLNAEATGKWDQALKNAIESEGRAAEMAKKMGDNLAGALVRLDSAVEGFFLALGQPATGGGFAAFIDGLSGMVNAITTFVEEVPGAGAVIVGLGAAFVGLVAAAPFIAAFISILGSLKVALAGLAIGAKIAGSLTVVSVVLGKIGAALAAFGAVIKGFLLVAAGLISWPVLVAAALVAAAAAIWVFRDQIMEGLKAAMDAIGQWVQGLWQWGEPIRQFWAGLWESIKALAMGFVQWLGTVFSGAILQPIQQALSGLVGIFQAAWSAVRDWLGGFLATLGQLFFQLYVEPIAGALQAIQGFFQTSWTAVQSWLGGFLANLGRLFYQLYIEPIAAALTFIQGLFQAAWSGVVAFFQQQVIQPLLQAWTAFTQSLSTLLQAAAARLQQVWSSFVSAFQAAVVQPILNAWQQMLNAMGSLIQSVASTWQSIWASIGSAMMSAFSNLVQAFNTGVIQPLTTAWTTFVQSLGQAWTAISDAFQSAVVDPIKSAWQSLQDWLSGIVQGAASAVSNAFQSIAGGILGAFRGIVGTVGRIINSIIDAINRFIQGVNTVRNAVGLSSISTISNVSIPTFAKGGFVKRATLAVVGEGGEPEYIVPESKMAAASANYLAGARGDSVLAAGPAVMAAASPSAVAGGTGGPAQINITTGPVLEFEGRRYVTVEDLQSAARQTATQIYATLRTPAGRRAIGVA
jgi:TP901 family phage tail tape measure protein